MDAGPAVSDGGRLDAGAPCAGEDVGVDAGEDAGTSGNMGG